jgi:hypothetical protein
MNVDNLIANVHEIQDHDDARQEINDRLYAMQDKSAEDGERKGILSSLFGRSDAELDRQSLQAALDAGEEMLGQLPEWQRIYESVGNSEGANRIASLISEVSQTNQDLREKLAALDNARSDRRPIDTKAGGAHEVYR